MNTINSRAAQREISNLGLFARIGHNFSNRFSGQGLSAAAHEIDAKQVVRTLLDLILLIGAFRLVSEMLILSAGLDPVLQWGLALVSLAISEGGFVAWWTAWRAPRSNKSQRDVALGMMIVHGLVSVSFSTANFVGQATAANGLSLNGTPLQSQSLVITILAIAMIVAIVANLVAVPVFHEMDDDEADKRSAAQDQRDLERDQQKNAHTLQMANQHAAAMQDYARTMATAAAQINLAPILAVLKGLKEAEETARAQFGGVVPEEVLSAILQDVFQQLPDVLLEQYKATLADSGIAGLGEELLSKDGGLERMAELLQRGLQNGMGAARSSRPGPAQHARAYSPDPPVPAPVGFGNNGNGFSGNGHGHGLGGDDPADPR